MSTDPKICTRGISAVALLKKHYQRGAYRIIRDPDGVISIWAIEGTGKTPFSVSFADQGRIRGRIDQMSPAFIKAFLEYMSCI